MDDGGCLPLENSLVDQEREEVGSADVHLAEDASGSYPGAVSSDHDYRAPKSCKNSSEMAA